jgi:hypothetical protein
MSFWHPSLFDVKGYYLTSDNILQANDAVVAYSATVTYAKLKTIQLLTLRRQRETIRTYFEMETSNSTVTAYGRVYKNGVAFGTERSTTSTSYVSFSEDLLFAEGDTVELWGHVSSTGYNEYVRNFRILGLVIFVAKSANAFVASNV